VSNSDQAAFSGVKVFGASMFHERERLGERVTDWIESQGDAIQIVDIVQTQSSDDTHHLVSITVFYSEIGKPRIDHAIKIPSADGTTTRRLSFKASK